MGSDDCETVFESTQPRICEELGWVQPRTFAESWLAYFSGERWFADGFCAGHRDEFTAGIARAVLAERLARPFDAVTNNLPWPTMNATRFLLWLASEDLGHRLHVVAGGREAESAKRTFLVFAITQRLLYGGAWGGGFDAFENALKEESIRILHEEFADLNQDFGKLLPLMGEHLL